MRKIQNVEAGWQEQTRSHREPAERGQDTAPGAAGPGLPCSPHMWRPARVDGAVVSAWPTASFLTVFGNVLGTPNSVAPGKRCGSRSSLRATPPPTLLCPGRCRPGTGGSRLAQTLPEREGQRKPLCVPRQKTGVFGEKVGRGSQGFLSGPPASRCSEWGVLNLPRRSGPSSLGHLPVWVSGGAPGLSA